MRPNEARDDAAPVDVPNEHDRHTGCLRKSHVGDVAGSQIDLGGTSGALDEDDIHPLPDEAKALQHFRQQLRLPAPILGGAHPAGALPLHDHLRAGFAFRLQQHRIHVDRRREAGGARLQGLRSPDLAAVNGDRGVIRHVLRFERRHLQTTTQERPRQPRHHRGLADVAAGALDHDGGGRHHAGSPYCRSIKRASHPRVTNHIRLLPRPFAP